MVSLRGRLQSCCYVKLLPIISLMSEYQRTIPLDTCCIGLLYFFERQPYLASHMTTAEKALKLKLLTLYNNEYNTNVRRALFGTS